MKALIVVASCVAGLLSGPVFGHDDPNEPKRQMIDGVVKKVDKKSNAVTLEHQPITNLKWPAATKEFHVRNPALLEKLKPGDNVVFSARNIDGTVLVTSIEPASAHAQKEAHAH